MLLFYLLPTFALPLAQANRLFLTNNEGWDHPHIRSLFKVLDTTTHHDLILCAPKHGRGPPGPTAHPIEPPQTNDERLNDGSESNEETSDADEETPLLDGNRDTRNRPLDDGRNIFDRPTPSHAPRPRNDQATVEKLTSQFTGEFDPSDARLTNIPHIGRSAFPPAVRNLSQILYSAGHPEGTYYQPQLYLAGPKVGNSFHPEGRMNPARWMIDQRFGPGIHFAGANTGDEAPAGLSSTIYAQLATKIIQQVLEGRRYPYLHLGSYLSVNFPLVTSKRCNNLRDFKFILTSSELQDRSWLKRRHCGKRDLPQEQDVVARGDGCYVAITEFKAFPAVSMGGNLITPAKIIQILGPILSCLPE